LICVLLAEQEDFIYSPALSGKEDLSMGEDIRRKIAKDDTFDNENISA